MTTDKTHGPLYLSSLPGQLFHGESQSFFNPKIQSEELKVQPSDLEMIMMTEIVRRKMACDANVKLDFTHTVPP